MTPSKQRKPKPVVRKKKPISCAAAGKLGGLARAKRLSKERMVEIGRSGGIARAAKLHPKKRSRLARRAARARWSKQNG